VYFDVGVKEIREMDSNDNIIYSAFTNDYSSFFCYQYCSVK